MFIIILNQNMEMLPARCLETTKKTIKLYLKISAFHSPYCISLTLPTDTTQIQGETKMIIQDVTKREIETLKVRTLKTNKANIKLIQKSNTREHKMIQK